MTDRVIVRLAEIAHEYDQAGKPHFADVIENAMIRLSQSDTQNFWNGVKAVGNGIADDAKAAGNAIAMPFEGVGAAAKATWNGGGLAYAPQAAGQAEEAAWNRAKDYTSQELQQYQQAAPGLAGPGGTGLPGAMAADAVHSMGNAVSNAAQGYVDNAVTRQDEERQRTNMTQWLQQAMQTHRTNGNGWSVINNAIQYGQLSAKNQATLRQQFAVAAAQIGGR